VLGGWVVGVVRVQGARNSVLLTPDFGGCRFDGLSPAQARSPVRLTESQIVNRVSLAEAEVH
jgi:hypothetical protein